MINKYQVILLLGLILTFNSCRKEDDTRARIHLRLLYNGEPAVTQQDMIYPDGKVFVLTRFSTYLSELTIHSGSEQQRLKDVQFINLTETLKNSGSSAQGYTIFDGAIDLASVDRVDFNIGLTPGQNATVPADHPPGHPLAMPGEYWLAWQSYIFTKIEGWIDLDGDGMAETGVALHLGSDEVKKAISLVNPENTTELTIQIDLAKVFKQHKIYDIAATPQIHSLSQIEALRELSNNLENAITIKTTL